MASATASSTLPRFPVARACNARARPIARSYSSMNCAFWRGFAGASFIRPRTLSSYLRAYFRARSRLLLVVAYREECARHARAPAADPGFFSSDFSPQSQNAPLVVRLDRSFDERTLQFVPLRRIRVLLQVLFEDARKLDGTVAGFAESSAEFLLLGLQTVASCAKQSGAAAAPGSAGKLRAVTSSFCGLRFWIAESVCERCGALASHVEIRVVLGDPVEQRQEAIDSDQPFAIVSRSRSAGASC